MTDLVISKTSEVAGLADFEHKLQELRSQYGTVPDLTTKQGYKEAKKAIQTLTKFRTSTDKARKDITAPLRDRVQQVNDLGKWLISEVEKIERPIRDAKEQVDTEIERKNEARRDKIREGIERDITVYVDTAVGLGQADIMQMVNELRALDVAIYGELEKEADDERQRVIGILSTMAIDAMQKAQEERAGDGHAVAPALPAEKDIENGWDAGIRDEVDKRILDGLSSYAAAWDKALDDLQAQVGLTEEQAENVIQAIIAGDIRGIEFNH